MSDATITVAAIYPPDPGKKNWKLKTDQGNFQVAPEDHGMFTVGETYQISYEDREYNGFKFKVFKAFKAETRPTPATSVPAAENSYQAQEAKKAERIFVCGIVNAGVSAGKIPLEATAIAIVVRQARDAWRNTFGDMNDEIP